LNDLTDARTEALLRQVTQLNRLAADAARRVEALEAQPPAADVNVVVGQLSKTTTNLDERLTAIESSIVENPGRALELPLLRSDMENLALRMQDDREDAAAAVDDVRTLVYASVAGIVLSLAGLLASTFVSRRFGRAAAD
jgi:hypothetical protein